MNIHELKQHLKDSEDRRKAQVWVDAPRPTNAAFNGHICVLPTGLRTYHGMYWKCGACWQYWHVQVIANTHRWQMFDYVPTPTEPTDAVI